MANYNNSFFNSLPPVTRSVLVINAMIWVVCGLLRQTWLVDILSLYPISSGKFLPHQLITYMFTQKEFSHFFFNMFAVFMFGRSLEYYWGSKRFLIFYMVTGIGAGLIQLLVIGLRTHFLLQNIAPDLVQMISENGIQLLREGKNYIGELGTLNLTMNTATIGASGSVFGLLLAFGMLFPNIPLYLFFIPIPIKAKYMVIGYGLLELYLGFAGRAGDNVAHFAHLGGMLFGIFMILYWRKKRMDHDNLYY